MFQHRVSVESCLGAQTEPEQKLLVMRADSSDRKPSHDFPTDESKTQEVAHKTGTGRATTLSLQGEL